VPRAKVFISYAWEEEPHATWVKELATRLRTKDGVDITLDRWEAQPGDELTCFMEKSVRESRFVLLICTPTYKAKFDERMGGVGYEAQNITGEISVGLAKRKIIPIHRNGAWKEAAPSIVLGSFYVDLTADPYSEANYRMLIDTLHGRRESAPAIGLGDVLFEGPGAVPARPVANFTGRDVEMTALVEHLRGSREEAVCLVAAGIGGVGKTSLARQFVATHGPALFPEGAAWLDGARLVAELGRICRRFGWHEPNDPPPQEALTFLQSKLHDRALLLVVDNLPEIVDRKLVPIPGGRCRTLITSRATDVAQDLDVPAATIRLEHWPSDVCLEYFREVVPRLVHENDRDLVALATFVRGLPLAIRLTARALGQNVARTAKQQLERLEKEPLGNLDAAIGANDRGVAATFLASYCALGPAEQATLLALSSSALSTRAEIVAAVANNTVDTTEDALNTLYRISLVEHRPGTPAPWGLHDVVRLFTRAQPESVHFDAAHLTWVRNRLAAYADPLAYEQLDEGIPESVAAFTRLVANENFTDSSLLLSSIVVHLERQGRYAQLAELIESLLALRADADDHYGAMWLGNLGRCYKALGKIRRAIDLHQRALAIAERLGQLEGQANELDSLGSCFQILGEVTKAIDFHLRALAIDEALARLAGQASDLGNLGVCYQTLDEAAKAIGFHQRALAIAERLGQLEGQARELGNLGLCYKTLGDIQKAIDLQQRALAIAERLGQLEGQARQLGNLGVCYQALGDTPKAIGFHQRALELNEETGRLTGQAFELGSLGGCYQALGDIPKAVDCYQRALALNEEIGRRQGEANVLYNLGLCHEALDEIPKAVDFHQRALAIYKEIGRLEDQADALYYLGKWHWTLNDISTAIGFHQRALALNEFLRKLEDQSRSLFYLGLCYKALGAIEEAIGFHQRGLAIEKELGQLQGEARHLRNLGLCHETLGEIEEAIDFYQRALAIYKELGRLGDQAAALYYLGNCCRRLGDTRKAIEFFERGLGVEEKLGQLEGQVSYLFSLGLCYEALGEIANAIDFHQRALAIDEKTGRLEGQAKDLYNLGSLYRKLGEIAKAIDVHERCLAITEKLGRTERLPHQLYVLGVCCENLGEIPKAIDFLQRCLQILGTPGGPELEPSFQEVASALEWCRSRLT
jgi:tetratricopeptide (TPR) repeat protein